MIGRRLKKILALLKAKHGESIFLSTVWVCKSAPDMSLEFSMDPDLAIVSSNAAQWYAQLKSTGCKLSTGLAAHAAASGAVQIVQNVNGLSDHGYPGCCIRDANLDHMDAFVYIPLYDLRRPAEPPVAILETIFTAPAGHIFSLADFISFLDGTLLQFQCSLYGPTRLQPKPLSSRTKRFTTWPEQACRSSSVLDADCDGAEHLVGKQGLQRLRSMEGCKKHCFLDDAVVPLAEDWMPSCISLPIALVSFPSHPVPV